MNHSLKIILACTMFYYAGRAHEKHLFNYFEYEQRQYWAYHFTPDIDVLTPTKEN